MCQAVPRLFKFEPAAAKMLNRHRSFLDETACLTTTFLCLLLHLGFLKSKESLELTLPCISRPRHPILHISGL